MAISTSLVPLTPKQAVEYWINSGVNKHAQRFEVTLLKALLAGVFLSYGGMLEAVVGGSPGASANNVSLKKPVPIVRKY